CPTSLRDPEAQAQFAATPADAAVVAAYGLILPPAILQAPRHGCLNVHASLLPRWRGAAPIQRALLAGDAETGITIMQMDEGLDWRLPAIALERQVRAFDPWPGAYFCGRGERIRILMADADPRSVAEVPGTVLDERLSVACGDGVLRPLRLQRPGRSALDTAA